MTSSRALAALLAIVVVQAITDLAVLFLGRRGAALMRALPYLVSGAAGVLLTTACLDLLPEAVHLDGAGSTVWLIFLVSLLALFCVQALAEQATVGPAPTSATAVADRSMPAPDLEHRLPLHTHRHAVRGNTSTLPLLLGSALHSGVDGLAIAAAFTAGKGPGWSAAIAVALHEFPHRLGDYSLLLHKGVNEKQAAKLAILAGGTALVGGLAVALLGHYAQGARWLLPVSAASFLYIALVDLLPEIQSQRESGRMWWELACLLGGAAFIAAVIHYPGE